MSRKFFFEYHDRGCQKVVQLQHLDQHEGSCGFTPAVCTNPGCGATFGKGYRNSHGDTNG